MGEEAQGVLFLCTGNSARSILAEAILNRAGAGRFRAYSAGSKPVGAVNPCALKLLSDEGYPLEGLHSKSWDVFARPGAPRIDFVFTVCDNAAGETCPVWPGHPMSAHWGIEDPAAVAGSDAARMAAFRAAHDALRERIGAFLQLDLQKLDPAILRQRLTDIGRLAQVSG
ncbi:MAG: arsenate reductase ArsC [Methyloligellaceae bacterium]